MERPRGQPQQPRLHPSELLEGARRENVCKLAVLFSLLPSRGGRPPLSCKWWLLGWHTHSRTMNTSAWKARLWGWLTGAPGGALKWLGSKGIQNAHTVSNRNGRVFKEFI